MEDEEFTEKEKLFHLIDYNGYDLNDLIETLSSDMIKDLIVIWHNKISKE